MDWMAQTPRICGLAHSIPSAGSIVAELRVPVAATLRSQVKHAPDRREQIDAAVQALFPFLPELAVVLEPSRRVAQGLRFQAAVMFAGYDPAFDQP
jgi:hypothetical protein